MRPPRTLARKRRSPDPARLADTEGAVWAVAIVGVCYYLLTVELGWTADRHRSWLCEPLVVEPLGPRSP